MINNSTLMGRLTFEPELRSTPNGVSVLRFQVACDRNYQSPGKEREADYIDCIAWRHTAEFISRYFHKGSMIAVEGCIRTRNYTDKNGNKRKRMEIEAQNVSFCGSKPANGAPEAAATQQPSPSYAAPDEEYEEILDDDLPF
ncbi:MAG: single-stranded DNA-binding protein [Eubacterium sp.]|nr:single-stranded DNA-binding protein [Eubacterium sp.]